MSTPTMTPILENMRTQVIDVNQQSMAINNVDVNASTTQGLNPYLHNNSHAHTSDNNIAPTEISQVSLACDWYRAPTSNGNCAFSPMAVVQSAFAIPSKIVEPALMSLPSGLVPIVALAVNVGAWWMVWRGVEKYWLKPKVLGRIGK